MTILDFQHLDFWVELWKAVTLWATNLISFIGAHWTHSNPLQRTSLPINFSLDFVNTKSVALYKRSFLGRSFLEGWEKSNSTDCFQQCPTTGRSRSAMGWCYLQKWAARENIRCSDVLRSSKTSLLMRFCNFWITYASCSQTHTV